MHKNKTAHYIIIGIVGGILAIGALISLGSYVQTQSKLRLEESQRKYQEEKEASEASAGDFRELQVDECLADAYKQYEKDWKKESRSLGYTNNKLPLEYVEIHERRYENAKDDCYR